MIGAPYEGHSDSLGRDRVVSPCLVPPRSWRTSSAAKGGPLPGRGTSNRDLFGRQAVGGLLLGVPTSATWRSKLASLRPGGARPKPAGKRTRGCGAASRDGRSAPSRIVPYSITPGSAPRARRHQIPEAVPSTPPPPGRTAPISTRLSALAGQNAVYSAVGGGWSHVALETRPTLYQP